MNEAELQSAITRNTNLIREKNAEIQELKRQIGELESLYDQYTIAVRKLDNERASRTAKLLIKAVLGQKSKVAGRYISGMKGLVNGQDFQKAYTGLEHSKVTIGNKIAELDAEIEAKRSEISRLFSSNSNLMTQLRAIEREQNEQ